MFVVVLTDEGQQLVGPRAVGPFEDFDAAQRMSSALTQQWETEAGDSPTASVVRVEEPDPGIVVGEIQ
ncbi:hypothetical protein [uncultured Jatrophihabitans sp.]|uniref:hypothetical protein n=1 Tax=uncultured Jatrophihabitans sp. TaxID=1610747 RepID=UPI0035C97258